MRTARLPPYSLYRPPTVSMAMTEQNIDHGTNFRPWYLQSKPAMRKRIQLPEVEKRVHTPEEWAFIRPFFTEHYAIQGHTLDETQKMLLRDYNFYATWV